ncbi:Inositol-pentakisphosphate 2-kinase [Mycena venus]|uniref:Inositol-pentakisphosphate 2-kinase n=1 Tax=Mycena venus TaxID=2733690 RepID=A0A8H6XAY8_9AGAR|nr:Inositol-pentakisphosphate 2-kinase [Mycena venus]
MSPSLTDTLPTDWAYISEGGANIVFVYQGLSSPFFDGTALRLRKRESTDKDKDEKDSTREIQSIEYQKKCLERLIPLVHLPRLELVVSARLHRALERREKDGIDVKLPRALLATNLVGGQGIAVEIKPKWGFLPSPTYLSDSTRPIKTRTCRFCMHSHLKAQQGEKVSSGYCPLDLFSGDETRMKAALNSLWDAWSDSDGTTNNFKVFISGKKILPAERASIVGVVNDMADPKDALISALLPVLTNTSILRTLSCLQRTLDALDIEGLAPLWDLASVGTDPTIAEWAEFVSAYLAAPSPAPPADPAHLRYHVLAYLLSATFKDCSVIVRVPDGTATVIDLDPKSVDRLRKWEEMDKEIVAAYAGVPVADRKVCVDSDVLR